MAVRSGHLRSRGRGARIHATGAASAPGALVPWPLRRRGCLRMPELDHQAELVEVGAPAGDLAVGVELVDLAIGDVRVAAAGRKRAEGTVVVPAPDELGDDRIPGGVVAGLGDLAIRECVGPALRVVLDEGIWALVALTASVDEHAVVGKQLPHCIPIAVVKRLMLGADRVDVAPCDISTPPMVALRWSKPKP